MLFGRLLRSSKIIQIKKYLSKIDAKLKEKNMVSKQKYYTSLYFTFINSIVSGIIIFVRVRYTSYCKKSKKQMFVATKDDIVHKIKTILTKLFRIYVIYSISYHFIPFVSPICTPLATEKEERNW